MAKSTVTSKELCDALKRKYVHKTVAVLTEVTMTDEEAAHLQRSAQVIMNPSLKSWFTKKGQSYDETLILPAGYDPRTAVVNRRIDALIFEGQKRTAVEIKVSRADFFRDTLEKRSGWMRHTDRFVYLTPVGLVKPEEVPDGCGLWEYSADQGFINAVKRAKVNKAVEDFPPAMFTYFAWRAFIAESKLR